MRISGRRKRAKVLERKEIGIFIVLFALGIVFAFWSAFSLIQGSPRLDDLQCVHGTVKQVQRIDRWRGWGDYRITLEMDEQETVYSLSQRYRPDKTGAIEKLTPGSLIQLYLEKTDKIWKGDAWVNGSVYGIYDRYGNPIHPIEASWREREKNYRIGLWFGCAIGALGGVCIWLLFRHPEWVARMNRWSESVPKRRYIEFERRKRE